MRRQRDKEKILRETWREGMSKKILKNQLN